MVAEGAEGLAGLILSDEFPGVRDSQYERFRYLASSGFKASSSGCAGSTGRDSEAENLIQYYYILLMNCIMFPVMIEEFGKIHFLESLHVYII